MLKKTTFALFTFALFVGSGSTLFAQDAPAFTPAAPSGWVELKGVVQLDLEEATSLTPLGKGDQAKSLTHCFAFSGASATGVGYAIPVGFLLNAAAVALPSWGSFATGGTTTYASTCPNLSGIAPCQLFAFSTAPPPAGWGQNAIINPPVGLILQSIGCL
jgi:hypothetical protein